MMMKWTIQIDRATGLTRVDKLIAERKMSIVPITIEPLLLSLGYPA